MAVQDDLEAGPVGEEGVPALAAGPILRSVRLCLKSSQFGALLHDPKHAGSRTF